MRSLPDEILFVNAVDSWRRKGGNAHDIDPGRGAGEGAGETLGRQTRDNAREGGSSGFQSRLHQKIGRRCHQMDRTGERRVHRRIAKLDACFCDQGAGANAGESAQGTPGRRRRTCSLRYSGSPSQKRWHIRSGGNGCVLHGFEELRCGR
jgi:hypothetical protein